MSKQVVERLVAEFGARILEVNDFRGDDEVRVAPSDWVAVATFLRDNDACVMDHFTDLTAIDWPERAPEEPRFDVLVLVRSYSKKHRIRVRTRVAENEKVPTLVHVWPGADWAEREVWDMFGIPFDGHPDLRRILLYPEFEGFPLRKDYPIEKAQPSCRTAKWRFLVPPFGADMGQPWGRGTGRRVSITKSTTFRRPSLFRKASAAC
ncbi:MAG: NADH-quinone oxidoreductase subunit C [Polyangiales bacterium]